jgi:hypothetical protein
MSKSSAPGKGIDQAVGEIPLRRETGKQPQHGGETPWHAAVRETSEEIDGIDVRLGVVAAELEVPRDHGCGWTYTTFAVRIQNTEAGHLPTFRVASGHAAWETAGLAWVPAEQVSDHPGLHPGLRAAWPTLRDAIRRGSGASDTR